MVIQSFQKKKLLILQQILLEQTDDEHSLTVNDIISLLHKEGIKSERKTVYDDIATLSSCGMDIVIDKKSHANAYYVASRIFQDEELQVLADAVASSKFLTKKKSDELIKSLQGLTSKFKAQQLRRSIYVSNRVKTFNELIYYNINVIHQAIFKDKQITFKYLEYTIDKKKRFKHEGELYHVSPYYLIWENDFYYLICYCSKHNSICRYRVDKISNVNCYDEKRRKLSGDETDLAKTLRTTYSMYGGENANVTLELDINIIGVILDRYGDKVTFNKKTESTCTVNIDIQISPPFWGWLFQFGKSAKILSPQSIADLAVVKLDEIRNNYIVK